MSLIASQYSISYISRALPGLLGPDRRAIPEMSVTTITTTISSNGSHIVTSTTSQTGNDGANQFIAAPEVNGSPDRLKFAYWVPNVSGGLVISKIPQNTQ
jgi:alkanesulfonate monooxygenase